jgi:hypothetical protein
LDLCCRFEAAYLPFLFPGVLMRDFSPIVLVLARSLGHRWEHVSMGCRITAKFVGHECERWLPLVFQRPYEKSSWRLSCRGGG